MENTCIKYLTSDYILSCEEITDFTLLELNDYILDNNVSYILKCYFSMLCAISDFLHYSDIKNEWKKKSGRYVKTNKRNIQDEDMSHMCFACLQSIIKPIEQFDYDEDLDIVELKLKCMMKWSKIYLDMIEKKHH